MKKILKIGKVPLGADTERIVIGKIDQLIDASNRHDQDLDHIIETIKWNAEQCKHDQEPKAVEGPLEMKCAECSNDYDWHLVTSSNHLFTRNAKPQDEPCHQGSETEAKEEYPEVCFDCIAGVTHAFNGDWHELKIKDPQLLSNAYMKLRSQFLKSLEK